MPAACLLGLPQLQVEVSTAQMVGTAMSGYAPAAPTKPLNAIEVQVLGGPEGDPSRGGDRGDRSGCEGSAGVVYRWGHRLHGAGRGMGRPGRVGAGGRGQRGVARHPDCPRWGGPGLSATP